MRVYWPVATRDKKPAAALEAQVRALKVAIKTELNGDLELGGACESVDVGDADAGWLQLDNATWRTLTVPLTLDMTDTDTLAR